MGEAFRKLSEKKPGGSCLGSDLSDDEWLAFQCEHAGITIERGRELKAKQLDTQGRKPMGESWAGVPTVAKAAAMAGASRLRSRRSCSSSPKGKQGQL